jgi:hypothetical protein
MTREFRTMKKMALRWHRLLALAVIFALAATLASRTIHVTISSSNDGLGEC